MLQLAATRTAHLVKKWAHWVACQSSYVFTVNVPATQGQQTDSSQAEQQALRAMRNMYTSTPVQATLVKGIHSLHTEATAQQAHHASTTEPQERQSLPASSRRIHTQCRSRHCDLLFHLQCSEDPTGSQDSNLRHQRHASQRAATQVRRHRCIRCGSLQALEAVKQAPQHATELSSGAAAGSVPLCSLS